MDAGVRALGWRSPAARPPHLQATGFVRASSRASPAYCERGKRISSKQLSRSLQRRATSDFKGKNDEGKGSDEVRLCHIRCFFPTDNIQINE